MDKENERQHKTALELLLECHKGMHKFEEIYRHGNSMEENVTRWCRVCGSVVVDVDYDNRTNSGQIMKMKSPIVSKLLLFLLRKK